MSEQYYSIPELKYIYLEDSYVIAIEEKEAIIIFFMDFVLQENHPEYEPPKDDEIYCFKRGTIKFIRPSKVDWQVKLMNPLTDSSGEIDYGNIDKFVILGNSYNLSGEWGKIEIISKSVSEKVSR
ncbi:hypothetical protein [Synechococcus sp. PCC 7336]|uniref:hypothetical protein n=1 Tax=Synechococcus sp. PCC 7336 TaxID=195250 RepID=UPI00056F38B6|nr:hypothetical protein [Synechococcus sp. PCC 7336]